MVSVSVCYLFYQPMDEKIKTWTLRFPAKENPNMEKALFDWPIVLQYDVKAKYRLISRKFSGMKFFSPERSLNQPKATRVCFRSINQSNRSISVRLLFLFCSRVFISRSYKNRSIPSGKTRLAFQMFRCSWKFSAGKTQRVMFHVLSNLIFRKLLVNSKQPLWFTLVLFRSPIFKVTVIQIGVVRIDSPWDCSLSFTFNTEFFLSQLLIRSHTMANELNTWREREKGGGVTLPA